MRVARGPQRGRAVPDGAVDVLLANYVLEHFPHREIPAILSNWARVLRPGTGVLKMRMPSLREQCRALASGFWSADTASYWIFGGQRNAGDFHTVGFTRESLGRHLAAAGLTVVHFDEPRLPYDAASAFLYRWMTVTARKI